MKYFFILFFTTTLFANNSLENQDFNIKKFSGLWYEIARMENSYQTSCVASSVEYVLQKNNTYNVFNRCFENSLDGKLIEYNGSAKKISNNNISKLKMRYFIFFTKEYNVIYININLHKFTTKLYFILINYKINYKEVFVKYFFILFFTTTLFANNSLKNQDFDIKKFSGLWYEIARMENSYQTSCVASSVEYVLQKDNTYNVFNRCFENSLDGKLIEYNGSAKKISDNNISKLKMRYFIFFTKEYNVIYINNYETAVVANDDFSSLWIMSRIPFMNNKELENILNNLKNKMNTSKLIFTKLDPKGRYK